MMNNNLRVVFMGSPQFAVPSLRRLAAETQVVGVVTQPDRPAGRGRVLTPPPVKEVAASLGIDVIQPHRLREPEAFERLAAWRPDLIVVAAFGQILRQNVLDLPPYGCINVHASLLPRWRGAAPIQAALLHGDQETGVTIMKMDAGVDTGPMLSQRATQVDPDDNAETLSERLAEMGAVLLVETLPGYLRGEIKPQPQDDTQATYAPMLKKEDGLLDFSQPADELANKVRAFYPWPGAFFHWGDQMIKVQKVRSLPEGDLAPGETGVRSGQPVVGAGGGLLVLEEVQPAGKRSMPGKVFLNGARAWGQMPVQQAE